MQALGDLGITQAFQLAPEKGPSHRDRQSIKQFVQGLQGFQQQPALLGRRRTLLRQQRQGIEVGLFETAPLIEVGQQPLADGRQIGAGFLQVGNALGAGEHPHESILAQVRRIAAIAHASPQPAFQPATMVAVQVVEILRRRHRCFTHVKEPCAGNILNATHSN
ncbi:hypothetical protein D3C87_1469310 [compost metagenome]